MPAYPVNFSPVAPSSEKLSLVTRQSVSSSPYSGATTVVNNYSSWALELNFPRMGLDKSLVHTAWMDSLRGSIGTFYYTPRSGVIANPYSVKTVGVIYPSATVAMLGGFPANGSTQLRVGQYISVGDQLVRLTVAPTIADGSGRAIVEINTQIRSLRPSGAAVEVNAPRGIFRLSMGESGVGYQIDPDRAAEFQTLVAGEAL